MGSWCRGLRRQAQQRGRGIVTPRTAGDSRRGLGVRLATVGRRSRSARPRPYTCDRQPLATAHWRSHPVPHEGDAALSVLPAWRVGAREHRRRAQRGRAGPREDELHPMVRRAGPARTAATRTPAAARSSACWSECRITSRGRAGHSPPRRLNGRASDNAPGHEARQPASGCATAATARSASPRRSP